MIQKRWGFGFGTVFSLIVTYFIFLYSRQNGWSVLAFISKWYLIIALSLIGLSLGIMILAIVISLLMFLIALFKMHRLGKKHKKQKATDYVDAEYKVKE